MTIDYGINSHLDENGAPKIINRIYTVDERFHGFRADLFLKQKIPRLSRNRLQKYIKLLTTRDQKSIKPHTKVFKGDELLMVMEARQEPPCPRTYTCLYEDDEIMVVDKPSGLPVHSSAKFYFNTLIRVLFEHYPDKRMHLCHRLDRETSGCIVIAKNKKAAGILKQDFKKRLPQKTYTALVLGHPPWQEKTLLNYPLDLVPKERGMPNRMEVREDGLESSTEVLNIESTVHGTLVQCRLLTGRQHQIRVHCHHAGYPIVGDKLYTHGDEAFKKYCKEGLTQELHGMFKLRRHALHASQIVFKHPTSGVTIKAVAPLPKEIEHFLRTGTDTDDALF